ncbi:hypothetical protein [Ferrimonas balearica]|uniref:hypothetical protein n=1 Tax=Ferrimonas balearica TaxID=44012 RepID=UPI001C5960F1|nr:hypothetical protein [Ferrimonas balearica]MBW3165928.1 hypothetical protein [Ferrimonas balearica]
MCRSPVPKLALALLPLVLLTALMLSARSWAGQWGWSVHYGSPHVSYGHYRYGAPYYTGRWHYPWYPSRWERRYWDDRYRYPYRYPYRSTPKPKPQPKVVVQSPPRTLTQEQTERGSRATLPANARLIQTGQGTRYQWQGQCYRYDYLVDRYQAEPCPPQP